MRGEFRDHIDLIIVDGYLTSYGLQKFVSKIEISVLNKKHIIDQVERKLMELRIMKSRLTDKDSRF